MDKLKAFANPFYRASSAEICCSLLAGVSGGHFSRFGLPALRDLVVLR